MSFQKDGYWIARGLLDPISDVQPLVLALQHLVDKLLPVYGINDNTARLGERLGLLLRKSRGRVMDHIDPVLNLFSPDYQWHPNYPTAQLPELFQHMRNVKILDALESVLGPEISVSPIYHFNMKLGFEDNAQAADVQKLLPGRRWLYEFNVGHTKWHADAPYGFRDAYDSDVIVAWTPLSRATLETSCLQVCPGSHRSDAWRERFPEECPESAVSLETVPGDVIFMDHRLLHAATINKARQEVRYSCNIRYAPTGQPTGRPFLPGFVARSRSRPESELRDADLWREMWAAAFDNLVRCELPLPAATSVSLQDARAVTKRWNALILNDRDWLTLKDRPSRSLLIRLLRPLRAMIRRWRAAILLLR